MLCIAVLLWGTAYKMEQYPQQGHACKVMCPAKLLTEQERPHREGLQRASAAWLDSSPVFWQPTAGPHSVPALNGEGQQFAGILHPFIGPLRGKVDPAQVHFSFRPPPALF